LNFVFKLILVVLASSAVGLAAYFIIVSTSPADKPSSAAPPDKSAQNADAGADEKESPKPRVIYKANPARNHQPERTEISRDDDAANPAEEDNASALKLKSGYQIPKDAEVARFVIPAREVEACKSIEDIYERMRESDSIFTTDDLGNPIVLVTKVAEKGLIHKIGFRVGDKIRAINGYSVSNMLDAVALYTRLKDEKQFSVELERDGKKMVYRYRIGQ
jgi:C-terminal processing protease CtpA/Prc